jgi:nucleoid-associated protein YgaU
MKQFEISELEDISALNFANCFNVYDEPKLGVSYKTYNINRTMTFPDLDDSSTNNNSLFVKYLVEVGDTWTTISFKFYQNIELWWLVAKVNNIIDPSKDPITGTFIRILKGEFVNQTLQEMSEN